MKKFSDLPQYVQDKINERFGRWGINGEEAYNSVYNSLYSERQRQIEEMKESI